SHSIPNSLEVSLRSNYGLSVLPVSSTRSVHPGSQYEVFAGDAETCPAVDPSQWTSSPALIPPELPTFPATSGAHTAVSVPMGTFTLTGVHNHRIRATTTTGPDHPACKDSGSGTPMVVTYEFDVGSGTR